MVAAIQTSSLLLELPPKKRLLIAWLHTCVFPHHCLRVFEEAGGKLLENQPVH